MKTETMTLRQLFSKDVRYVVPKFQRAYVWNEERQWEPLWGDIRDAAERYLDGDRTGDHFLGAMVAELKDFGAREIERREVIDGQQRLTTLQLLLDAATATFEELECSEQAAHLRLLVRNQELYASRDADLAFKVWPTEEDQAAFRHAMDRQEPDDGDFKEHLTVKAHAYFRETIRDWLQESGPLLDRADALHVTLTELLRLVVIDLEDSDDPYVIFETLNARGTPLLAFDMIKSYLMSEAGKESERIHQQHLKHFEGRWWKKEIGQGRLLRPRVDVFINYWLMMRTRQEVATARVFDRFQKYAKGESAEDIAADLERVGRKYHDLEELRDDSALGAFLHRWRVMQAGALTPTLLWLLSHDAIGQARLERSTRALESWLVRRMVCRLSTRGWADMSHALVRQLEDAGPERADDAIVAHLAEQDTEATLWPDDRRLTDAFVSEPLYTRLTRGRLRLVLERLEEEIRPDKAEIQTHGALTVEHAMPQAWHEHWPLNAEPNEREEAKYRRESAIHTIGNLTLVTQKLNTSASNGPWERKREALDDHSALFLNKDLLRYAGDEWDEAAIEERGRRLAALAAAAWPAADAI